MKTPYVRGRDYPVEASFRMSDIYDSKPATGIHHQGIVADFDTSEPITFPGSMYVLVTDSW